MSEVVKGSGGEAETVAAGAPPVSPPTADASTLGAALLPPGGERPSVPGYEVVEEVGRGGMGVVYKARQKGLDRFVALKMILAGGHAGPEQLARFQREGQAVARLAHPGIVQVYEVGSHEGRSYLALEYVGGGTLAQRTAGRPLPARESARLVEALARAVHYAHTKGVVHRDLKPGNILLQRSEVRSQKSDGGAAEEGGPSDLWPLTSDLWPKITDFGLAKMLDPEPGAGPAAQTQSGSILGTPAYMAPEQAGGKRLEVGPHTDVYALGAILYELLTGRPPFLADTPVDTILKVVTEEPTPPTRLVPKVPRDLEGVCLKCLEKEPGKRYASASELADDLRRFLDDEPTRARPLGRGARLRRWARRRKWWLVGGAAGACLLVLLGCSLALNALALFTLGRVETGGPPEPTVSGEPLGPVVKEVPAELPEDLALVPRDAVGFVSVRVAELWKRKDVRGVNEALARAKLVPLEGVVAGLEKTLPVGLETLERATLVSLRPEPTWGSFVAILAAAKPYPPDLIRRRLERRGFQARRFRGKSYFHLEGKGGGSFYPQGERVLVYSLQEDSLCEWLARVPPRDATGPLRPALDLATGRHHVVAGFAPPRTLRDLLVKNLQNTFPGPPLGAELAQPDPRPLGEMETATLTADLKSVADGDSVDGLVDGVEVQLKITYPDAGAARKGQTALAELRDFLATLRKLNAPEEQEGAPQVIARELSRALRATQIEQRDKATRLVFRMEWDPGFPAVAVADLKGAADRVRHINNLKQLGIAMHQYADAHGGRLPPAVVYGKDGKRPLYSWRVELLPYLEQNNLYNEFKKDEPWDGPHNKKLLAKMPKLFAVPGAPPREGKTFYQVFTGPNTPFPGRTGLRMPADFVGGTGKTILITEASTPVEWTAPRDITPPAGDALKRSFGTRFGKYFVVLADASVKALPKTISAETLRRAVDPRDGKPLGSDWPR